MFFRKSLFGRGQSSQDKQAKKSSRRRSSLGRRTVAMEPLEERRLLAVINNFPPTGTVATYGEPDTSYYAQSFPALNNKPLDLTFQMTSLGGPDAVEFHVLVTETAVDGTGIHPTNVVYEGATRTLPAGSPATNFVEDLRGTLLTPGTTYAFMLDQFVTRDGSNGSANVGARNGYPDGVFFFFNAGAGGTRAGHFAADWSENGSDLAFSLTFADTVVATGTSGPDTFLIKRNGANIDVTVNGVTTSTPITDITEIDVNGLDGNDVLTVDSSTGGIPVPISYDGGNDNDALVLTGGTATSDRYDAGPNPGQGTSTMVIGGVTQLVTFSNLEPVFDNVAGPLVVNGTNADNAINYTTGKNSPANFLANITDPTWGEVSVDNFEPIEFTNKTTLTINALAGSDTINLNNPTTPAGPLTSITVNGGDPTGSDTLIVNGIAGSNDTITYTPTGVGAGTVSGAGPTVTFSTTEHLSVVGNIADDDIFDFNQPAGAGADTYEYTPGATYDAGSVTGFRAGDFPFTPVDFSGIGQFISLSVFTDLTDTVIFNGTDADDVFTVADSVNFPGFLSVIVNGHTESFFGGNLVLRGLSGNDTFNLDFDPASGVPTRTIRVEGGDSDGSSDTINYTATPAGGLVTVDLGAHTITQPGANPVSFSGVERVDLDANANSVSVIGTPGDDTLDVSPTGLDAVKVQANGVSPIINSSNVGATFTVSNGGGIDALNFHGTPAAGGETFNLSRNLAGPTLEIVGRQIVSAALGFSVWNILGSNGPDTFNINEAGGGGITGIELNIEAGPAIGDTLNYNTPFNQTYRPGSANDAGTFDLGFVPSAQVTFDGIDAANVIYSGAGATIATIQAAGGANQITVTGTAASTVVARVDNGTPVTFSGTLTTVNVNAGAGDDVISVTPGTFTGIGGINVSGGDPTASDTVIINGTAGADIVNIAVTGPDSATVTGLGAPIVVNTAEQLIYNGQGGIDSLTVTTPAGFDLITFTPGIDATQASIDIRSTNGPLLPLNYVNIAPTGSLTFANTGGAPEDQLDFFGTSKDDVFNVTSAGVIDLRENVGFGTLEALLTNNTPGIASLHLLGLDGDDTFSIPGNHPFPGILGTAIKIEGGNPSASDVLNFIAAAAPVNGVNISLANSTIGQNPAFGLVGFSGVEVINVSASGQAVNLSGTIFDDDVTVTVNSAGSGKIEIGYAVQQSGQVDPAVGFPVINYSVLPAAPGNALNVNLLAGEDTLVVVGNAFNQTFDVNVPAGSVAIDDGPVVGNDGLVTFGAIESLSVFGLEGNDVFTVTPGAIPVFVDGGDPIGTGATPADTIVLVPVGFFSIEAGPEKDEGGMFNPPNQRVSWDHIERVTVNGSGSPGLILGTNGDDDITVIARDASTHPFPGVDGVQDFTVSVNDGPEVLYINQSTLFIDALAGDDDIVIRAPAPNGVDWDVDITVAGGPPASATTDQGDTLELETPGAASTVIFTALGPDTATLVLDQAVNDSNINMVATFTFDPAGINYISSPGGIENVVYDGVDAGGFDVLTINGNFNDTTNYNAATFEGNYSSILSPRLDFSLVGRLTVNAGIGNFDVVNIVGSEGDDTVTSTATAITVVTPGSTGIVTLGAGIDLVTLATLAGNDNIDLDLNVAGLRKSVDAGAGNDIVNMAGTIDADIYGGDGNDNIVGSPAADLIFGGSGNDVIDAGAGTDDVYGEAGNDTITGGTNPAGAGNEDRLHGGDDFDIFIWNPGDGSDIVDGGGDGADILTFNATAGADILDLFPAANPTHNNVRIGGVGGAVVDTHGVEQINVNALGGADIISVADLTTTEVVSVRLNLGAADGAVDSVTYNGRNLADNLLVSTVPAGILIAGLEYDVTVEAAAATDLLTVNGNEGDDVITAAAGTSSAVVLTLAGGGGNDTLDASATTVTGVFLEGDAGDDTLRGGSGNDSLRGESGAIFGNDTFVGNGGTDLVGAGGGLLGDRILVPGTPGNDVITLALDVAGHLLVTINGVTTTYTDFGGGPIVGSGVDLIAVVGGEGGDRVTVDSTNGAIPIAIEYDGGSGSDSLTLTGGVAISDTYSPGPNPGQGTSTIVIGVVTQLVTFQNIEPVVDFVAGPLVVNGTPADNAINFAANVITIDNFESISIGNKTDVTINAGNGSDTINVNGPAGLSGGLFVNGGNPTASDTLIVNGVAGVDDDITYTPTGTGAGTVTSTALGFVNVTFTGTEHLTIVGQEADGDSLRQTGTAANDTLEVTVGATRDAGSTTGFSTGAAGFTFTPMSYRGFVDFLVFPQGNVPGGSDTLIVNATNFDDTITFNNSFAPFGPGFPAILVSRAGVTHAPIFFAIGDTTNVVLRGLDGDDTFNVGPLGSYTGAVRVEGGNPSASDVLNFFGSPTVANLITASYGGSFVQEATFGPVNFTSIEILNIAAALHPLTIAGSAGDDDITVTPANATSGKVELGYAVQQNGQVDQAVGFPVINYSGLVAAGLITAVTPANALTFDLGAGEDTLVVVGNALSQTFHVNANTVPAPAGFTIPGLAASTLVVDDLNNATNDGAVTWLNLESLSVFGLEGNDTFNVNAGPIPVFVDGGDPIGTIPGDRLVPFGTFAFFAGPESDEGGFLSDAGGTISFDHIESIVVPPPGVGACPFLIVGTNADDDITVIARDASTHVGADGIQDFTVSINDGPDILFLDQPDLFIDALSGDDDIVIRTRAPNGEDWDVNVRIVGGPPSAATGDQGDVVEIETPNNAAGDDAFWTPTGPETGFMVLDEGVVNGVYDAAGTDTIIQILSSFIFVCPDAIPPFTYISSPGGVELVEYDGESSTDNMTINGTALNDTTTVSPLDGPGGSGQGSFVSPGSPLFNFRAFDALTVNGGAGGFDHVIYNATEGPDVITSTATAVLLAGTTVTMDANVDKLTVNALGGNDSVSLINLTVASGDPVIVGGDGDDTLVGSPFADLIFGGFGNDILIGAGGNDTEYGEAGNDRFGEPAVRDTLSNDPGDDRFFGGEGSDEFFWDPGDGSDTIEGGAGEADILRFFGSAGAETFNIFADLADPSRAVLTRTLAAIRISMAGIDEIDVQGNDGADNYVIGRANDGDLGDDPASTLGLDPTATLSDLSTTEVRVVNVNLATVLVASADNVFVDGRPLDDNILVSVESAATSVIRVAGLPYDVRILNSSVLQDRLTVRGNEGNDTIKSVNPTFGGALSVEAIIGITLTGGAGNDSLSADAILIGGIGNDDMVGGAGPDQFFGNAGEDVMYGGGGQDTYDGGADFDTIRIPGTSGADSIDVRQSAAGILEYLVVNQFGITVEDATVVSGTQDVITNVEEARVDAGSGADTIRIAVAQALHNDGVNGNALRMTVNGGDDQASDRLGVIDVDAADTTILRQNEDITGGTVEVGPGYEFAPFVNGDSFLTVFNGVEFVQVLSDGIAPDAIPPIEVETPGLVNRLVVFKHDAYEQNNSRNNATHLGANFAINLDPKIDPGPGLFGFPADSDWFRVEAKVTGTLDFQAFFEEIAALANGNPGLPGNGNIDIFLYDVDGTFIAGNGTGGDGVALTNFSGINFGDNDGGNGGTGELDVDGDAFFENERIRIPAVQGQIYYLRVVGVGSAVNNYNLTVLNEAAPVPYDLELNDIIFPDPVPGVVTAGVSTTQFNGNLALPAVDNFFNGKVVSFAFDTLTPALRGREATVATVAGYIGATRTFILSTPLPAVPVAGDTFQVESIDTGRNNEDNNTRDNTPMIVFRLDDAILINDLPGNDVSDTPPDEVIPIQFIPGPLFGTPGFTTGFRIAIFDEGTTPGGEIVTPPQTPLGFATFGGDLNENGILDAGEVFTPGVYQFTTPVLVDGSHFITARVQMIDPSNTDGAPTIPGVQPMTGFGGRSLSLEIVVDTVIPPVSFDDPARNDDGLLADSDSGVSPPNPETIIDLITNDVTPTFWGRAEANSIIRLYVDNRNLTDFPLTQLGVFDQFDIFIGQDTAIPTDGNQQEPNGYWEINSIVNFNDPRFFPVLDGVRRVFVTAEDVAGNVNAPDLLDTVSFDIFVDTQGPQVTSVQIDGFENYDLFNPKGRNANLQGPTPLIKRLDINFRDLPPRVAPFLYRALKDVEMGEATETLVTDHFQLIGDQVGRIAIQSVFVVSNFPPANNQIATAQVQLVFFSPLADDRYTLIITDDVRDPVGNRLDGETNAAEPQENPRFPSGDGIPGGDFVARFTVDSRPELAVYAGIRVYVDTNGNFVYDPEGQDNDAVNRDIIYRFGSTSDALFAGKFVAPPGVAGVPVPPNPGAIGGANNRYFDQFAAYGNILGSFRWLFDFDSNGVADLVKTQGPGFQIDGLPVAGNFDGVASNGDEVGLFTGTTWYLDTNHNFVIDGGDLVVVSALRGFPQVGDMDGDGRDDLITYQNDTYFVDFFNNGFGGVDATIPLTLDGGGLGFPGVAERPTVADMNQDGIDDFGVWVPGNLGQTPREISEWFYLVSEAPPGSGNPQVTHIPGTPVAGNIPGTLWAFETFSLTGGVVRRHFEPVPFGTSLFAVFGDEPAFPIVGNFDPPTSDTVTDPGQGSNGALSSNDIIVTAPGPGTQPLVKVYNRATGEVMMEIMAYASNFRGGVQVATGDVNGDGILDIITAPGPGGGPQVRVFDGATGDRIKNFMAYASNFYGGVSLATGDFNGDGKADIVTAPGKGMGPHVKVFNGVTGAVITKFFAYEQAFTGGIHVTVGDTDGNGAPEIITAPDRGGSSQVRIFNVAGQRLRQIIAYPNFTGGVWLAAGDVNGDGRDDIITGAGVNGGPQIRTFNGVNGNRMLSFMAYASTYRGGVRVAAGDFDGDGKADILAAPGSGTTGLVRIFDGQTATMQANFQPYAGFTGGIYVAAQPAVGGLALHADSEGAGAESLTQAELDQIVAAAISQLESSIGAGYGDLLRSVNFRIADLAGTHVGLAFANANEVAIDADAAGHGWFVDSTPDTSDDLDASRIDLLSVIEHELGHILGLDDLDGSDELMSGVLSLGQRHSAAVRAVDAVDSVFAELDLG